MAAVWTVAAVGVVGGVLMGGLAVSQRALIFNGTRQNQDCVIQSARCAFTR